MIDSMGDDDYMIDEGSFPINLPFLVDTFGGSRDMPTESIHICEQDLLIRPPAFLTYWEVSINAVHVTVFAPTGKWAAGHPTLRERAERVVGQTLDVDLAAKEWAWHAEREMSHKELLAYVAQSSQSFMSFGRAVTRNEYESRIRRNLFGRGC